MLNRTPFNRSLIHMTISLALGFYGVVACSKKKTVTQPPTPPPQDQSKPEEPIDDKPEDGNNIPAMSLTVEPTMESIQRNLVDKNCVSCHQSATSSNRFIALGDLAIVIQTPGGHQDHDGMRHDLISPGCPSQSFFYTIMREGKMPTPPATKVSEENLKTVEKWIISLRPDAGPTCGSDDDEPGDDGGGDDEPGDDGDDEPGS